MFVYWRNFLPYPSPLPFSEAKQLIWNLGVKCDFKGKFCVLIFLQVQLESMTEMWAGSLEVGVTSHDPATIVLPPTMTSMPTETWMLSGTSVIINGQETTKNYAGISLETIQVSKS